MGNVAAKKVVSSDVGLSTPHVRQFFSASVGSAMIADGYFEFRRHTALEDLGLRSDGGVLAFPNERVEDPLGVKV